MSKHLGLAFVVVLALVNGLFAENEQKAESKKVQVKQWDTRSDDIVKMSDDEWENERKNLQQATKDLKDQTLRVRQQTQYIQVGNVRRWIERRGGWGIAADFDFLISAFDYLSSNYYVAGVGSYTVSTTTQELGGIFQVGPKVGVVKRFRRFELRALSGVGFTAGDVTSFYVPFSAEIGFARVTKEKSSIILGLSYTYSPKFSKQEIYVAIPLGKIALKLAYGAGSVSEQAVFNSAATFSTLGINIPLTFPL